MKRYNIELHIEELVLHGFAPRDRALIGEAVQRELLQIFAEQGIQPSPGKSHEVERLDGGEFHIPPGAKAGTVGSHIARTIYGGLERGVQERRNAK